MPAGQPCKICSADAETLKRVNEMIGDGATELAIAKACGFSRSSVNRHRQNHVLAVATRIAQAAAKGAGVREQRELAVRAAESGDRDPAAWLALEAIVGDLRRVHERLERSAAAAEENRQLIAVGALGAQQLRAVETRARLGQVGNYAPQKQQGSEQTTFAVNFHFSGGRTERVETTIDASPAPTTMDMPAINMPVLDIDLGAAPVVPATTTVSITRAAQILPPGFEEYEDNAED